MANLLAPPLPSRVYVSPYVISELLPTPKIIHAKTLQLPKLRKSVKVFSSDQDDRSCLKNLHPADFGTHLINENEGATSGSELWNSDRLSENSSGLCNSSPAVPDSLSLGIKEPTYEVFCLSSVLVVMGLYRRLNKQPYRLTYIKCLKTMRCYVTTTASEYQVIEVKPNGDSFKREINRRQLFKSSGLRQRDVRAVDPLLWVTNSMPSLLVREQAILLNLGSLRAIAMRDSALVFDHRSKGGQAFLQTLLPRLNPKTSNGAPVMPFELEVVEAALISRTQRLEQILMEVESRVTTLLEVVPNRLTADTLEQLRLSKQALVELASRTGSLRQMLLELLEDSNVIRRIAILGRSCIVRKSDGSIECSLPLDKHIAEEEAEEVEMLLENYLQRCESCHGQAEQLLDSAREMEDSISVNLSSRRLEVGRLELLLQVGTFCIALGALVAGIFGMNLKSYLEERVFAFWITTAAIVFGALFLFMIMHSYLKRRKIL